MKAMGIIMIAIKLLAVVVTVCNILSDSTTWANWLSLAIMWALVVKAHFDFKECVALEDAVRKLDDRIKFGLKGDGK